MKKKTLFIIISVIIIIAIITGILLLVNKKPVENNLNIDSAEDMGNLVDQIYSGLEGTIPPSLNTVKLDISNMDLVKTYTGLDNIEGIQDIVVSEPMISSQAFSLILVKCESETKADEISAKMNESVNPNKWICVSAEKVYSTSSGDVAMLVMASEDWAKPVYDKFKELAGSVGNEYEKNGFQKNILKLKARI